MAMMGTHSALFGVLFFVVVVLTTLSSGAATESESSAYNIQKWMESARPFEVNLNQLVDERAIEALKQKTLVEKAQVLVVNVDCNPYVSENASVDGQTNSLKMAAKSMHIAQLKVLVRIPSLRLNGRSCRVGDYTDSKEVTKASFIELEATGRKHRVLTEWLQQGLYDVKNVDYEKGTSFLDGAEKLQTSVDIYVSPSSPYRKLLIKHVVDLLRAGVDGVVLQSPDYAFAPHDGKEATSLREQGDKQTLSQWGDWSPFATKKFFKDTGLHAPDRGSTVDWDSRAFRSFIEWRYQQTASLVADVVAAGTRVKPDAQFVVEARAGDQGTMYGFFGGDLKQLKNVITMERIRAASEREGREAQATASLKYSSLAELKSFDVAQADARDEYISVIAKNKLARSFMSGTKPAWVELEVAVDGGAQGQLAQTSAHRTSSNVAAGLLLGEALSSGNNPILNVNRDKQSKGDAALLQKVNTWMSTHGDYLQCPSAAEVGVWYSRESRDFLDKDTVDGEISNRQNEYDSHYIAEYHGVTKALVHRKIPFDVLVSPSAVELDKYKTVVMPRVYAMSDGDAALLTRYVKAGGSLLVLGAHSSELDEKGNERPNFALAELMGISKQQMDALERQQQGGKHASLLVTGEISSSTAQAHTAEENLLLSVHHAMPGLELASSFAEVHEVVDTSVPLAVRQRKKADENEIAREMAQQLDNSEAHLDANFFLSHTVTAGRGKVRIFRSFLGKHYLLHGAKKVADKIQSAVLELMSKDDAMPCELDVTLRGAHDSVHMEVAHKPMSVSASEEQAARQAEEDSVMAHPRMMFLEEKEKYDHAQIRVKKAKLNKHWWTASSGLEKIDGARFRKETIIHLTNFVGVGMLHQHHSWVDVPTEISVHLKMPSTSKGPQRVRVASLDATVDAVFAEDAAAHASTKGSVNAISEQERVTLEGKVLSAKKRLATLARRLERMRARVMTANNQIKAGVSVADRQKLEMRANKVAQAAKLLADMGSAIKVIADRANMAAAVASHSVAKAPVSSRQRQLKLKKKIDLAAVDEDVRMRSDLQALDLEADADAEDQMESGETSVDGTILIEQDARVKAAATEDVHDRNLENEVSTVLMEVQTLSKKFGEHMSHQDTFTTVPANQDWRDVQFDSSKMSTGELAVTFNVKFRRHVIIVVTPNA